MPVKSQTHREVGSESQGSLSPREIAGPPGRRQSGFIVSGGFDYAKANSSIEDLEKALSFFLS
jgi:hypothetical protein